MGLLTSHVISRVSVSVGSLRTPVGFLLGAGNKVAGNKKRMRMESGGRKDGGMDTSSNGTKLEQGEKKEGLNKGRGNKKWWDGTRL